jgi:HAD superfamily hydrolase (TIGR01509 family)
MHSMDSIPHTRSDAHDDAQSCDLIIFDCDGVLVDSERITARVFADMLGELGFAVTLRDIFDQFVGKSMDQCLEIISRSFGREVPPGFVAEYRTRSGLALHSEVKAVAGIEAVLAAIRVPFCVASNGTDEKMRTTLGVTGLLDKFSGKMFSIADVTRGKPFPDLFLHAAARFGVPPSRCAVIEDTPTGVSAGVAAGMTVYGYCALTPAHLLTEAGAHCTFDRMERLPALLRSAGNGALPPVVR